MSNHRKMVIVTLIFLAAVLFVLCRRSVKRTDPVGDDIDTSRSYVYNGVHVEGVLRVDSTKTLNNLQPQQPIVADTDIGIRDHNDNAEIAPKHVSEYSTSQSHGSKCTPARDLVYIKVHKTGSSTLQNIFYRFGDERDLTFMLPAQNFYIEGVGQFKPSGILKPPPGKNYNIMANHARFFYKDFKKIMPVDTKFVTLIREAASHFASMYSYFVLKRQYKVELEEFSLKPKVYFEKYDLNKMGRLSGRDPQLFDLGLGKKDMYNVTKVDDYIQFLDEKMDLVLLTEYFLESLILLKDVMCWDMQTIVHLNSKMRVPLGKGKGGKTSDTNSAKADALTKRLNEWHAGDFKLYDHFNRTLWQKVESYGRDRMESEIAELKELSQRYENECMSGTKVRDISYWSGPIGLKEYVIRKEKAQNMTCKRLGMSEPEFVPYLRKKHKSRLQR